MKIRLICCALSGVWVIRAIAATIVISVAAGWSVAGQALHTYAGRSVAGGAARAAASGLPLIFSDDLVPATLRVKSEPKACRPRDVAIEILAPHGLTLTSGPRDRLLVVKLPRRPRQAARPPQGASNRRRPTPGPEPVAGSTSSGGARQRHGAPG